MISVEWAEPPGEQDIYFGDQPPWVPPGYRIAGKVDRSLGGITRLEPITRDYPTLMSKIGRMLRSMVAYAPDGP